MKSLNIKHYNDNIPSVITVGTFDGIHRTTFIVNEEGVVDEVIAKVKTKDHAAQILK